MKQGVSYVQDRKAKYGMHEVPTRKFGNPINACVHTTCPPNFSIRQRDLAVGAVLVVVEDVFGAE
jgi:hypothetical protein